jgi:hypothetical protein
MHNYIYNSSIVTTKYRVEFARTKSKTGYAPAPSESLNGHAPTSVPGVASPAPY